MTIDPDGWLKVAVTVGATAFLAGIASWGSVQGAIVKVNTWREGFETLMDERLTENARRLHEIEQKLGNGGPGVFVRRSEHHDLERRIDDLENQ